MVAAHNAHILYNWNKNKRNKLSFVDFLNVLIDDLVEETNEKNNNSSIGQDTEEDEEEEEEEEEDEKNEKEDAQVTGIKRKRFEKWVEDHSRLSSGSHTPQTVSAKSPDRRGRCTFCRTKSFIKCRECGVFLRANGLESCWWKFHHLIDIKESRLKQNSNNFVCYNFSFFRIFLEIFNQIGQ
jgi:hypothetical protein